MSTPIMEMTTSNSMSVRPRRVGCFMTTSGDGRLRRDVLARPSWNSQPGCTGHRLGHQTCYGITKNRVESAGKWRQGPTAEAYFLMHHHRQSAEECETKQTEAGSRRRLRGPNVRGFSRFLNPPNQPRSDLVQDWWNWRALSPDGFYQWSSASTVELGLIFFGKILEPIDKGFRSEGWPDLCRGGEDPRGRSGGLRHDGRARWLRPIYMGSRATPVINTSFVVCHDATGRHRNVRKARKTCLSSKDWRSYGAVTYLSLYAYNFC
jgi:hypothetical protein